MFTRFTSGQLQGSNDNFVLVKACLIFIHDMAKSLKEFKHCLLPVVNYCLSHITKQNLTKPAVKAIFEVC